MATPSPELVERQVFRFRLRSFKKNNADLEMTVSARTITEAWAEAKRRAKGFPYYLESIFSTPKPQQKRQPKRTAPRNS